MIKINLLGDSTGKSNSWTYGIIGYAASVVICAAFFFSAYQRIGNAVEDKERDIGRLKSQLAALKLQTAKVDELEKKRATLNSKLALIARLKKSKIGPVRVMDDLNMAVPSRVWLRSVQEKGGQFQIKGRALNNEDIALFLRNLEASDYFSQVELVNSLQMYYSKRTGKVAQTPDLQVLRNTNRATKETAAKEGAKGQHWAVRQGSQDRNERRAAVDEFNIKIKEFAVTAIVNYAGKLKLPAPADSTVQKAAIKG